MRIATAALCALLAGCGVDDEGALHQAFKLPPNFLAPIPGPRIPHIPRYCQELRDHIVWEAPQGPDSYRIPFVDWDRIWPGQRRREKLLNFYSDLLAGREIRMRLPDPLRNMGDELDNPDAQAIYLTDQEAFEIYAAHVAHVLYVEAARKVPWSICSLPAAEKDELLASWSYFSRIRPSVYDEPGRRYPLDDATGELLIRAGFDFQPTWSMNSAREHLVGDPREAYRFVRGTHSTAGDDLVGADEEETLIKLTAWMRDNVLHGAGPESVPPYRIHFGTHEYSSREEVASTAFLRHRLLPRDLSSVDPPTPSAIVARSGCHSASVLLRDLARGVNIPLLALSFIENSRGHQALAFRFAHAEGERRIVSHGDDLFNYWRAIHPMADDGRPLGDRGYYETTWRSPADLTDWDFLLDDYLALRPGADTATEFRYDHGRSLGRWNICPSIPEAPIDSHDAYQRERAFRNCDYDNSYNPFLTLYCDYQTLYCGPDSLPSECAAAKDTYVLNFAQYVLPSACGEPVRHDAAAHWDRAEACVRGHRDAHVAECVGLDGCACYLRQWAADWASRGRNVGVPYAGPPSP